MVRRGSKVHNLASSLLFLLMAATPRFSDTFVSQNPRRVCVSHSLDSGLCIHHLFVWSNFNFLHNSHWITLRTQLWVFHTRVSWIFPLKFERQVSSSLQDSSHYSGLSKQCYSLLGLHSSFFFPSPPIHIPIQYSLGVFEPALVDGLLLVSKWQQVSSGLRDSSKYSN